MQTLLTIRVQCMESCEVQGKTRKICMVPFTGEAGGDFFRGKTIGTGVDTQTYRESEAPSLSARYMLEGEDYTGQQCRIFIDNSLRDDSGWHPQVTTDSRALSAWEEEPLLATVDPAPGGVVVQIFRR